MINSHGDGYAIRTLLEWVINGPLQGNNDKQSESGYPAVTVIRTIVDRLEELLTNQCNHNFNERTSKDQEEMSREEKKIFEILESSVQEGYYKIKQLYKKENVTMLYNLCVAKERIHGLRKKIQKDSSFHEYTNFVAGVISKGYAEQEPQHQLEPCQGKVWYIPCHGVYYPKKGTLRVVFDCGVEFKRCLAQQSTSARPKPDLKSRWWRNMWTS